MANSSGSVTSQNFQSTPSNQNDASNEINIKLKVKHTLGLKFQKSDTVRKIKRMFMKEGVSERLLDLTFDNKSLEDDKTLAYYEIGDESTMKLELNTVSDHARKMYVQVPSGNHAIEIFAREDDTISAVKCIVMVKHKLKFDEFDLMFKGRLLQNYQTVSSAGINNDSLLYVAARPKDSQLNRVVVYSKGGLTMEVKKYQTIGELKKLLASMTRSQSEDAKMIYARKELKDSRTIDSYNIVEHGSITFMPKFPVNVELYTGASTTVNVYPLDDARKVLAKILKTLKWPNRIYPLFFNDDKLDEGRPIGAYEVLEGSTLRMGAPENGN